MSFLSKDDHHVIERIPLRLVCAIIIALIPLWNLFSPTTDLIGSSGGEVYGHAWMHWWRGEALPQWPQGTDLAIGSKQAPAIDPLAIVVSFLN